MAKKKMSYRLSYSTNCTQIKAFHYKNSPRSNSKEKLLIAESKCHMSQLPKTRARTRLVWFLCKTSVKSIPLLPKELRLVFKHKAPKLSRPFENPSTTSGIPANSTKFKHCHSQETTNGWLVY